jgi:membrane protease YdiL (CAAX protease family)
LGFGTGMFAALGCWIWWNSSHAIQSPGAMMQNGPLLSLVILGSTPFQIGVLVLAARLARWPAMQYLALVRPQRWHVALGIARVAVLAPALDGLTYLSGRDIVSRFQVETYQTARAIGWTPVLWLTFVFVAPAGEEITFRGFLYRGWAESRLGTSGAILLTSFAWSLLHIQYDWFLILQVFCVGLLLGWLRQLSGSTTLTILLHTCINFWATLETMVKIEWLS